MSFKRNTSTTMNFSKTTITDSSEYNDFIEARSDLKETIDNLIEEFIKWAKNPSYQKDYCYSSKTSLPHSGDWSVDEDEGSWEEFKDQMGTSHNKFSLNDSSNLPNETLRLIGNVFEEIGFTVFVVEFTPWRVDYDYEFTRLKDVKEKISDTDIEEAITINICISI